MKKITLLICLCVALLSGCGHSAKDSELVGQVKKVKLFTPMICGDYFGADISLGVMRNGVGSMSTQDVWVVVNKEQAAILKMANETGQFVKVHYDTKRVSFCTDMNDFATTVELTK